MGLLLSRLEPLRLADPAFLARYQWELLGVAAVAAFLVNAVVGALSNTARIWAARAVLCGADSPLTRQFALTPAGPNPTGELAWRENASTYKLWASGRRYTLGLQVTLNLRPRQDLAMLLYELARRREDEVELELFVPQGATPQTVLLIGPPKLVRSSLRSDRAVADFAKEMKVAKERVPGGWQSSRLAVAAEHPSLFYDLLNTEPSVAKALALPHFRSLLLTSEADTGNGSSMLACRLRFTFALPPPEASEDTYALLGAALTLLDLVGSYKVPADMKKRAQELRARLEQEASKKEVQSRQEQLQAKRAERVEADRAKARAAGPAALAKFEEKLAAKMRNRDIKRRMKVM